MRVDTVSIDNPQWREFAATHPDANPFHLPEWSSVLADCYGFEPFGLAVRDTDGELLAGVPVLSVRSPFGERRWVSLPFSDSCEMLLRPDTAPHDVVEALRDHVLAGSVRELEIRSALPATDGVYPVDAGYLHTVALPKDPADLHPNKGHRNSRNQAIRRGIEVTHRTAPEDIAKFYELHTLTRRRHGVPVQPRRFFDLIWERLIARGYGFVATASLDDEVLAAAVYLQHNGTIMAKYHASDPRLPDKGAGYLVDWESMVSACKAGHHTLDMGRSDPDAKGLRLYKSSWGAVERPLSYSHISATAPSAGRRLSGGDLSHRIIRSSPPWVCRALGEIFYRWAA